MDKTVEDLLNRLCTIPSAKSLAMQLKETLVFNCVVVDKKFLENEVKHVCYRQDSYGNVSETFELRISNIIYGKDDCPRDLECYRHDYACQQIIKFLENEGEKK